MQPTRNTLSENIRAQSGEFLSNHLAAAIDLYAQVKQAHWNVRGPDFLLVRELFDKLCTDLDHYSDLIAERTGGLGIAAHGTIHAAAARSFLVPYPLGIAEEHQHLFAVSEALAAFGRSLREAIGQATILGDEITADLFAEISRGIDQQIWFVESHIIAFKCQVSQEFVSGKTVHALAIRYHLSQGLIRAWVERYKAWAFDEDATAAEMVKEYVTRSLRLALVPAFP
jgi:starvation-inducible DNA-binding protein